MRIFDELCPRGPEWTVDWPRLRSAFAWLRRLEGVEQDPRHHAEGDVATHTRLAAEALASLPSWRALDPDHRARLFAAVLLHDVAKPYCTRTEADGSITAHGHSRRGELAARRILWELDAPLGFREQVAALVRHHQIPFWALERDDLEEIVLRVSITASNDDLATLATADILGRVCTDASAVLDNIALYREYCADLGVLDRPFPFANDHARYGYFATPGRDPRWAAYDDTAFTVTVMSGLPGVGKDYYVAGLDLPVISLDALRVSLGVRPTAPQGPVLAAARAQARSFLRTRTPFVWNATNVSRQVRQQVVSLAAGYGARVHVVSLEAPPGVVSARNSSRTSPVPAAAVERMIGRWETPDLTEAHAVSWLDTRL
ncbi:MAG: AAA family ATPase [Hamadaea sp.]|uniref:AAA family ATPase n=1 Tax=Hamadaea sp. TaxID=2024425 RepID=UPI00182E2BCD|nr:AAA family ATPase [Hamadaea sp.]NUR72990.1 AAA family ATPase [Hamadaea sp.]NUT21224.1 AAA family ATPase [Hamadaea sp.]